MAHSYAIWIDVEACTYKTSKSYGAKNTNYERVLVGTSAKHSHQLCDRTVTRKEFDEYRDFKKVIVFRSYQDKILLKEMILSQKTKEVLEIRQAKIEEFK